MLSPTKYQNLNQNMLVTGADIIDLAKKWVNHMEDILIHLRNKRDISVDDFYNILTFLWITEFISIINLRIYFKKDVFN